ncbi:MAG: hypothetical protein IPM34_08275 [Saprospiraceae bacterium]|nr:hypothetical protein [Saprospiraceae bacterium]
MKRILIAICIYSGVANSQPVKLWTNLYGGKATDVASAMTVLNDTAVFSIGRTSSTELPGHRGGDDFMICNFNPDGGLNYLKTYGGPSIDQANTLLQVSNDAILVGGFTTGRGGDVTMIHGLTDIWLTSINPANGNLLWQKNFGGTNNDQLNHLHFLETGRVLMAGHTKSIDRDVVTTPSKGGNDILLSSMSEAGVINKTVTFGGTKDETARKILNAEVFGGQMLVFGESESSDFDFQGMSKGGKDIFILKTNRNLTKIFIKTLGGPGDDLFADAVKLPDDTYMLFGTVSTKGGIVDTIKGGRDILIAKIDIQGNLLWKKILGGSLDDVAYQAQLGEDGHILLLSNSNSNDKDIKITPHGGTSDVLLMKMDTAGNILWQKYYGGTKGDNSSAITTDKRGHIYLIGSSFSTDFDLTAANTNPPDFWTTKLFECHPFYGMHRVSICEKDSIEINGRLYFKGFQSGIDTFIGGSVIGCDSILTVEVDLIQAVLTQAEEVLCHDSSLVLYNIFFDKNHTEDTFHLVTQNHGCDSLVAFKVSFTDPLEVSDTLIIKDDGTGKGCIGVQMSGGCEPYKYLWSTGWPGSTVCNLLSGTYQLSVTDCNNCIREFSFFVPSTVGTQERILLKPQIWFRSNSIEVVWEDHIIADLKILDMQGRSILSSQPKSNSCQMKIDILAHGVYVLQLSDKSGNSVVSLFVK